MDAPDVIVVGAGVNGLVAALALARTGLSVTVFEERPVPGGVMRMEYPFAKAPRLAAVTGVHRLGFFPAELARALKVDLGLAPRNPSVFVPSPAGGFLARDGNEGLRAAAGGAFDALHQELDAFVSDLQSAWLAGTMPIEDIADRYVRPELRERFVALCRGSLAEYVARFGIQSDLLRGFLAADALTGTWASFDAPGTGAPLLVRHAARTRAGGADAPVGSVVRALVEAAQAQRVSIVTAVAVREVTVEGNTAAGVVLADGRAIRCNTVIASADPVRLSALVGAQHLAGAFAAKIGSLARPGGIAKVNLALSALPKFASHPDPAGGQHRATTYLLPGAADGGTIKNLARAFAEAAAGAFPSSPPLECTFATPDNPDNLHHASIVVPWAPYDLAGTTWAAEEEKALAEVLNVLESFAPGTRALVVDAQLLHPKKLETHFGVTRGNLHHADDTLVFADRVSYVTPVTGIYSCSSACAPAGGMLGVAGYNAAMRALADFELGLERTEAGPRPD